MKLVIVILAGLLISAFGLTTSPVLTPFGYRPKECVLEVPSDATVTPLPNGQVQVTLSEVDEKTQLPIVKIVSVPSVCDNDIASIRNKMIRRKPEVGKPEFDINGWLDYGGWYPPSGENDLEFFSSTYVVPRNPSNPSGGQVLFYFIGMQDNDDPSAVNILQPVLTWGNGINAWYVKSWACCPNNITVSSPAVTGINQGDSIFGTIQRISPSTWKIDSNFKGQHTILNAQVGDYQYNWADVTLEVYNLNDCSMFANGAAFFNLLNLRDSQGTTLNPQWQFTGPTVCSGVIQQRSGNSVVISHN